MYGVEPFRTLPFDQTKSEVSKGDGWEGVPPENLDYPWKFSRPVQWLGTG